MLERSSLLILLFGTSGSGKTFLGDLFSKTFGLYHYELDLDLTPAMRNAIADDREFTEVMRDEYFSHLIPRITDLQSKHNRCILTQAVYKERHRQFLKTHIPDLELVWITAPQDLIVARLQERDGGISGEYALKIQHNFEPPVRGKKLLNDTADSKLLIDRFSSLFFDTYK